MTADPPYTVPFAPAAAAALYEHLTGPVAANPFRLGKPLASIHRLDSGLRFAVPAWPPAILAVLRGAVILPLAFCGLSGLCCRGWGGWPLGPCGGAVTGLAGQAGAAGGPQAASKRVIQLCS
jgi:hypothetical protein